MKRPFMRATHIVAMLVLGTTLSAQPATAATTEKITGLPMHDGLKFIQTMKVQICGFPAQVDEYDTPDSATMGPWLAWYRSKLPGSLYVHKVYMNAPQEMLYGANGTSGVSLTGIGRGAVYHVDYLKVAGKLTAAQMKAFAPDDPGCT